MNEGADEHYIFRPAHACLDPAAACLIKSDDRVTRANNILQLHQANGRQTSQKQFMYMVSTLAVVCLVSDAGYRDAEAHRHAWRTNRVISCTRGQCTGPACPPSASPASKQGVVWSHVHAPCTANAPWEGLLQTAVAWGSEPRRYSIITAYMAARRHKPLGRCNRWELGCAKCKACFGTKKTLFPPVLALWHLYNCQ